MTGTDPSRALGWTAAAAAAAMLVWMARILFTGEVPFTGDLLHFHYPLRDFYARALADGTSFEWMPSLFTGFHAAGEGQLGAYHPAHWLLYRLLPLDTAFAIEVVAPYPFLFAGTWLLLRRWTDTGAAALGALLFTFSGFTLSHGVHVNMVSVVAHLPWMLWAMHGAWAAPGARGRARGAALVAALTGSQLLLGHPQAVWFSVLVEAAYVALLATGATPRRGARLAALAGAKALGVLIGAVQVLATFHALGQADRAGADPSFATTFALPPAHLVQLVGPYLPWDRVWRWSETAGDEYAVYGGAVALALTAWWLASAPGRRARGDWGPADRLALGAAALGVVGLWLSLGARGGLYLLQAWLPVVGQFRAPARFVLFAHLALAVIAAVAAFRLSRAQALAARGGSPAAFDARGIPPDGVAPPSNIPDILGRRALPGGRLARLGATRDFHHGLPDRRAAWAPWLVAAIAAGTAAWWTFDGDGPGASLAPAALPVLVFVAAAALVTRAAGGSRAALAVLALLAAVDQGIYGLGGVVAWRDYISRPALAEVFEAETDGLVPRGPARIARGGNPNVWVLDGYRTLEGYAAIAPRRVLDYISGPALAAAGVGYVHRDLQRAAGLPGAEPVTDYWFHLPDPPPRVHLVAAARATTEPRVDIASIDVWQQALVERELELGGGPAGTAALVRDAPGDIAVRTQAEGRQLLVVSEGYDAWWAATVDGEPAVVERVNGDFLGVVVPAGAHDVALRFEPAHRPAGTALSLLGALGALLLALVGGRHRARESGAPTRTRTTRGPRPPR